MCTAGTAGAQTPPTPLHTLGTDARCSPATTHHDLQAEKQGGMTMCKGAEYQNYMVGMYVMDGCMPSLQPAGKYQRCIGAFLDVTKQMRGSPCTK